MRRCLATCPLPWHECPMRNAAAFLFVLLLSAAAIAGPKDDADQAIARGIAFRRQGDDAAALKEFQRAQEVSPTPRATAQVGLALQALGRWAEAEQQIEESLRAAQDPWIIKNRPTLDAALGTIRGHVGTLEVVGFPSGAEVLVEQRRVGVLPLPKPVRATAGTVAIEVRSPGYLPIIRNVSVTAETLSRETVKLTLSSAPALPGSSDPSVGGPSNIVATPEKPAATPWHVPAAWAAGAGAAVLLAGGVAALIVRGNKSDQLAHKTDIDHTCVRSGTTFSGADAATCADLATSKDTWTGVAVGTLIVAGVAGAAAIVLVATRPSAPDSAQSARATALPQLAAAIEPHLTFVTANWRF